MNVFVFFNVIPVFKIVNVIIGNFSYMKNNFSINGIGTKKYFTYN